MNKVHILALAVALTVSQVHAAAVPAAIDQRPQVTEGVVAATPAQLWRVWTTAEGYKQLGAAQCDVDFRVGGLIRSVYDPAAKLGDGSTIENEIMAYEPEHMLAFRIHKTPTGFPFPNAWKRFDPLSPSSTRVRLTHEGFRELASDFPAHASEFAQTRAYFTQAWAMVLKMAKAQEGQK